VCGGVASGRFIHEFPVPFFFLSFFFFVFFSTLDDPPIQRASRWNCDVFLEGCGVRAGSAERNSIVGGKKEGKREERKTPWDSL
jgi:hypothetical protein